jgi:hypothetical protein
LLLITINQLLFMKNINLKFSKVKDYTVYFFNKLFCSIKFKNSRSIKISKFNKNLTFFRNQYFKIIDYTDYLTRKLLYLINLKNSKFNKYLIFFRNRYFKTNDYIVNFFNKAFEFKNKKSTKISKFNKSLIFLMSIIFIYLFYLSIPTLYDKDNIQKNLTLKLLEEFKINLSLSASIDYLILPSPHFEIKNAKLIDESDKEVAHIKKLKIFISQKNLFKEENLEIKDIVMFNTNFLVRNDNISFFKKFLDSKTVSKKINIKKSQVFFKDNNEETILIFSIKNSDIFYDNEKEIKLTNTKGTIFNIPYIVNWNKFFKDEEASTTEINLNKLRIQINNYSKFDKNDKIKYSINKINTFQSKLKTNFKISKNLIIFDSKKSKLINSKIIYKGQIIFNPFNLNLNVEADKVNIDKLFNSSIIIKLLQTELFFNKNLSAQISFKIDEVIRNKLFDNSKIIVNFKNDQIDLNGSYLENKLIGQLKFTDSEIFLFDNELLFKGNLIWDIKNINKFYSTFQVPKKYRKNFKTVIFQIEKNLNKNKFIVKKISVDKMDELAINEVNEFIENFNSNKTNEIKNWIDLKLFVNKFFKIIS